MTEERACPVEGCDRTGLKGEKGVEMHIRVTNDPAHDEAEEGEVWEAGSGDPETPSEGTDGEGSSHEGDTPDETPEEGGDQGTDTPTPPSEDTDGEGSPQEGDTPDETPEDPPEEGEDTPDTEKDMPSTQELESQREQLAAPEEDTDDAQETQPVETGEPFALPSVDTRTLVLGIGVIICIGMALYLLRSDTSPEGEEITLEEEGDGPEEDQPEGGLA